MMPPSDSSSASAGRTVKLAVPARPGYVLLGRLALSAVCRLTPLEDHDVQDLKLAITEAASAFVGHGDDPAGPLAPEVDTEREQLLHFEFELGDTELAVEVACDADGALTEEERELSEAIVEATADRCESRPGAIRLVKRLAPAEGAPR